MRSNFDILQAVVKVLYSAGELRMGLLRSCAFHFVAFQMGNGCMVNNDILLHLKNVTMHVHVTMHKNNLHDA
jgi:hypothetical protein